MVSDNMCAGLSPTLLVGEEGLIIFELDFDFLALAAACLLQDSQVVFASFSFSVSSFSSNGHKISVDLQRKQQLNYCKQFFYMRIKTIGAFYMVPIT